MAKCQSGKVQYKTNNTRQIIVDFLVEFLVGFLCKGYLFANMTADLFHYCFYAHSESIAVIVAAGSYRQMKVIFGNVKVNQSRIGFDTGFGEV